MHLSGLLACLIAKSAQGKLPVGAVVLDSDIVWDTANEPNWTLSSDGSRIAYLSKGALWQCDVLHDPPKKLADLSRTAIDWMAKPEYDYARTNFNAIRARLGNEVYNRTIGKAEESVLHLREARTRGRTGAALVEDARWECDVDWC